MYLASSVKIRKYFKNLSEKEKRTWIKPSKIKGLRGIAKKIKKVQKKC